MQTVPYKAVKPGEEFFILFVSKPIKAKKLNDVLAIGVNGEFFSMLPAEDVGV